MRAETLELKYICLQLMKGLLEERCLFWYVQQNAAWICNCPDGLESSPTQFALALICLVVNIQR